jgi:hypothetical protein
MSENKGRLYPGRLLLSAEKRKAFSHGSHPDLYCMNDYVPYSRKEQGEPGRPGGKGDTIPISEFPETSNFPGENS